MFFGESAIPGKLPWLIFRCVRATAFVVLFETSLQVRAEPHVGLLRKLTAFQNVDVKHEPMRRFSFLKLCRARFSLPLRGRATRSPSGRSRVCGVHAGAGMRQRGALRAERAMPPSWCMRAEALVKQGTSQTRAVPAKSCVADQAKQDGAGSAELVAGGGAGWALDKVG